MNKKLLIWCTIILIATSSCSPKINMVKTKTYPPLDSTTKVTVYFEPQEVPEKSEAIGSLKIGDTGFSTKCDSVTVFTLAENETRKAGGNALLVTEHRRPSFWGGSCHQIAGTMLNVTDFASPTGIGIQDKIGTTNQFTIKPQKTAPVMAFEANIGYGWRTAQISNSISQENREYIKKLKSGFTWQVGGSYFFNNSWGLKLMVYQYRTSNSGEVYASQVGTYELETKDRITYIGPSCVFRVPFGKNGDTEYFFNAELGLGCAMYHSKQTAIHYPQGIKMMGATLGSQAAIGIEYKFDKAWGIGFNVSAISGVIGTVYINEEGNKYKKELSDAEGLGQVSTMIGLKYYINRK